MKLKKRYSLLGGPSTHSIHSGQALLGTRRQRLPAVRQGFTLIELLVAVGVLAIVSILIVQVFFTTTKVNSRLVTVRDIKQSGDFALDTMARLIRGAASETIPCDGSSQTATSAVLQNFDGDTTTLTCYSDGKAARIASVSGEGAVVYLTGDTMTTSFSGGATCADTTLSFTCPLLTIAASPPHFSFSLAPAGTAINSTNPDTFFQATVSVRSH